MAATPAQVAAALTQHDRVRRSMDIPLFYGVEAKDSITPHQLVKRVERAARVANWANDERKCDEFFLCLRDQGIAWANTLDNIPGFDQKNGTAVKTEFIAAFAPRFTAKTLCTSFQDLKQKSDEPVQLFYNRVSEVFRDAYMIKPDHVLTATRVGASTQDEADKIRLQGVMAMQLLTMNTVFLGGLKEDIRSKVLETGPTLIQESVKLAREIEIIVDDKKRKETKGTFVSSIKEEEAELVVDEEEAEALNKVNAIRVRNGQAPIRFRRRNGGRGRPAGNGTFGKCRYCKIPGHLQKFCRKRIAANAPCVDEQGKPYAVQGGVSAIKEGEEERQTYYMYAKN